MLLPARPTITAVTPWLTSEPILEAKLFIFGLLRANQKNAKTHRFNNPVLSLTVDWSLSLGNCIRTLETVNASISGFQ